MDVEMLGQLAIARSALTAASATFALNSSVRFCCSSKQTCRNDWSAIDRYLIAKI
jgi:hypothetical protein